MPLEAVTKIISGQKYVTASSVIILSAGLKNVYLELTNRKFKYGISKNVIRNISSGIKDISFSNVNIAEKAVNIATVLLVSIISKRV